MRHSLVVGATCYGHGRPGDDCPGVEHVDIDTGDKWRLESVNTIPVIDPPPYVIAAMMAFAALLLTAVTLAVLAMGAP